MLVTDFDYELPDELIAQYPPPRGTSRLMILNRSRGDVRHGAIADLPSTLRPGDLLVVNDTRVFAARLLGKRVPSGGAAECLLLGSADAAQPERATTLESELQANFVPASAKVSGRICDALVHPGQKLKPGSMMRFEGDAGVLMAEVLERRFHGRRRIRLWSDSGGDVDYLVDALGHIPLPPYIKRHDTSLDRERYQTVFSRVRGSVAAPTAGLHFTPKLLDELARQGIERCQITLHVGYGTFKPVRTSIVEEHVVDPESYEISESAARTIERARSEHRRVVAVGTTTTRALEDAAIRSRGTVAAGRATAELFIHPGFDFQVISGLLTNFHLPKSSLLMLVSAFAGRENVLATYAEAVRARYRFYSYGDAMLIV
jgi:S-adenosylmethionine:tRNA ribosyltransferase-isomerase